MCISCVYAVEVLTSNLQFGNTVQLDEQDFCSGLRSSRGSEGSYWVKSSMFISSSKSLLCQHVVHIIASIWQSQPAAKAKSYSLKWVWTELSSGQILQSSERFDWFKKNKQKKKHSRMPLTLDGTQRHGCRNSGRAIANSCKTHSLWDILFICGYISFPTHPFLSDEWLICKESFNQDRWHVNFSTWLPGTNRTSSAWFISIHCYSTDIFPAISSNTLQRNQHICLNKPMLDWIQVRGCECICAVLSSYFCLKVHHSRTIRGNKKI